MIVWDAGEDVEDGPFIGVIIVVVLDDWYDELPWLFCFDAWKLAGAAVLVVLVLGMELLLTAIAAEFEFPPVLFGWVHPVRSLFHTNPWAHTTIPRLGTHLTPSKYLSVEQNWLEDTHSLFAFKVYPGEQLFGFAEPIAPPVYKTQNAPFQVYPWMQFKPCNIEVHAWPLKKYPGLHCRFVEIDEIVVTEAELVAEFVADELFGAPLTTQALPSQVNPSIHKYPAVYKEQFLPLK